MIKSILVPVFLLSTFYTQAQNSSQWLNRISDSVRAKTEVPALVCAVIYNNSISYGLSGQLAVDDDRPVKLISPFHIGSNTKAVTSYIAFKLIEEGKISLDTKLFDLINDVKKRRWRYRNITLGSLLSHQSRIPAYTSGLDFLEVPSWVNGLSPAGQRLGFATHVVKQKPLKKGMHYSNAGYSLASLMLERASGQTYENLVSQYLGDQSINAFWGFPIRANDAYPKGHWIADGVLASHDSSHAYQLPTYMHSAGDLSMNIIDYSKFVQMQLNGLQGKSKSLPQSSFINMHYGVSKYAYGWGNQITGSDSASFHDGSAGTFYTHCIISLQYNMAIVVFVNSGSTQNAHKLVRESIIKQVKKQAKK
jgi:CubicO group peptidase (beta-lactamase class C family)